MASQQIMLLIDENDLQDVIQYLKDFSQIIGKSFHQAKDIMTQQQIATLNFDINKVIKKLENSIK